MTAASAAQETGFGDAVGWSGFRDTHLDSVRGYCEAICLPERVDEAVSTAFLDFVGRLADNDCNTGNGELLAKAARSAAASRVPVEPEAASEPLCFEMPELIAAVANGDLDIPREPIVTHLDRCEACESTRFKLAHAEDHLRPLIEVSERTSPQPRSEAPQDATQISETERRSEIPTPPDHQPEVRHRSGGLVGAAIRRVREARRQL